MSNAKAPNPIKGSCQVISSALPSVILIIMRTMGIIAIGIKKPTIA